jgi:EmrB/QacA subfamily drug resistance transporter
MSTSSTHIKRWRAFALLAVAYFTTTIDLTIVNVSLPTIGRDLHFTAASLQWVATAYALTYGGFLLLGGRAADLVGRRNVFLAGLTLFSASSLGCALAPSHLVLIAMRASQGLGAAVMLPASLSIVTNMFEKGAERNKALGMWGVLGAAGGTAGLIFGGVLTRYAGWQYIFYLNVPIGIVALALAPRIVPESRLETTRRGFDVLGSIVGTAGLITLVGALSEAPQHGWLATRTILLAVASVSLLVGFIVIERHAETPVLPLSVLRLRTLVGANIAALLVGGGFFAFLYTGTLYMQQVLHYSSLQTGLAWMTGSCTSMLLAGASQRLVTRVGPKPVLLAGTTSVAVAIIWATQAPVHGRFWTDLAGPFVLVGAGTALTFIPISIAALGSVTPDRAGLASGLYNTSMQLGTAIAIAIAASVAASRTRALAHLGGVTPAALAGGLQLAMSVLGALSLLALPVILVLMRSRRSEHLATNTAPTDARSVLVANS